MEITCSTTTLNGNTINDTISPRTVEPAPIIRTGSHVLRPGRYTSINNADRS